MQRAWLLGWDCTSESAIVWVSHDESSMIFNSNNDGGKTRRGMEGL